MNIRRLLLINVLYKSFKGFGTFLCMGRCKWPSLLKLFLLYASQYLGPNSAFWLVDMVDGFLVLSPILPSSSLLAGEEVAHGSLMAGIVSTALRNLYLEVWNPWWLWHGLFNIIAGNILFHRNVSSHIYAILLWHQGKIALGKVKQNEDLSKTIAPVQRDCTQFHINKMLFKNWNELEEKYWRTLEWRLINWDHTESFWSSNFVICDYPIWVC